MVNKVASATNIQTKPTCHLLLHFRLSLIAAHQPNLHLYKNQGPKSLLLSTPSVTFVRIHLIVSKCLLKKTSRDVSFTAWSTGLMWLWSACSSFPVSGSSNVSHCGRKQMIIRRIIRVKRHKHHEVRGLSGPSNPDLKKKKSGQRKPNVTQLYHTQSIKAFTISLALIILK